MIVISLCKFSSFFSTSCTLYGFESLRRSRARLAHMTYLNPNTSPNQRGECGGRSRAGI